MEGSTWSRIVVRGHTFVVDVDGRRYNISTHSYESILSLRLHLIFDTCIHFQHARMVMPNEIPHILSHDGSRHHAPLSRQGNTPLSYTYLSSRLYGHDN